MKSGTPNHPKTKALARRLRVALPHAVGILEMLWHFGRDYARQGDIGRFSDGEIADAVAWPSERPVEDLIEALLAERWLDKNPQHRLLIHGWSEHADKAVHT